VASLIRLGCTAARVTDPLSAAISTFERLGARKIGIVSPYTDDIARELSHQFERQGLTVTAHVSFGEKSEANVARIATQSIVAAAHAVAEHDVEAVFLSCTNLRTVAALEELEATLPVPVVSSNSALAAQILHLVGGDALQLVGKSDG
jgi:maleate isomerase